MSVTRNLIAALALAGLGSLMNAGIAGDTIDINTADAEALAAAIDGVGLRRAEAIVSYREMHGPFRTVDDLVSVRGVGAVTLERSRDRLSVGSGE